MSKLLLWFGIDYFLHIKYPPLFPALFYVPVHLKLRINLTFTKMLCLYYSPAWVYNVLSADIIKVNEIQALLWSVIYNARECSQQCTDVLLFLQSRSQAPRRPGPRSLSWKEGSLVLKLFPILTVYPVGTLTRTLSHCWRNNTWRRVGRMHISSPLTSKEGVIQILVHLN